MKQQAPPSRSAFYVGAVPTAWRLLGRRSRDIKLAISLRFLQAMLAGAPVIFLVWVVDHLRRGTLAPSHAWIATAGALVAVLAQGWVWYASNRFAWINGYLAVGEARASTLNHVQRLPLGTLRSRSTGDVTATFSTDFETVSQYITEALPALFGAIGLPVVVVAGLFFVDPALAGAVAISLLVAGPIFFWVNKRFKALALLRGNLMAESSGRMLEYVLGITVARAFNRTDDRMNRYGRTVGTMRQINNQLVLRLLPLGILTIFIVQLGVPLVIAFAAYRWFGGATDAATVLIFLVLVLRVYGPIVALAGYFEVARSGTTTAIVGRSGAGKTTILNLVSRFWDPLEGTVRIGGVDARQLTNQQLFEHVTVAFQDVYLFRSTIRENIAFGRPDASNHEIEAAALAAQAHEFIEALPLGYETLVGEGGATLSGGERQRLSIARAILKDSPIVLLDEPTSSLDSLNDRAVRTALAALLHGKTVIVVAHRLPTIQSADQILVVESGRIVQSGAHRELIQQPGGSYYHLWQDRKRALGWRIGETARTGQAV